MSRQKYQIGDLIDNKAGLLFKVEKTTREPFGNKGRSKTQYHAICSKCGYSVTTIISGHENRKTCPGCEEKPAAIKTDDASNCISICEIGTVEFVREYQDTHNVSERKAVQAFIEIAKAKLSNDDPVIDEITEGSIRANLKVAQSEPLLESTESKRKTKKYLCLPTIAGVQNFLNKHLPGYKIVHNDDKHNIGTI